MFSVLFGQKKALFFAAIILLMTIGSLGGIKALQIRALIASAAFEMPPTTVSSVQAHMAEWPREIITVGELRAAQGVMVSAEEMGKVAEIAFESGQWVKKGSLLVQQDIAVESAELKAAEAAFDIAEINFKRAEKLIKNKTIARSEYDDTRSRFLQAKADLQTIGARIERKTIRAPFDGQLGVRQIDVGQVIQPLDPIVSLQALDPIYVNFAVPQKALPSIRLGQSVNISGDMLGGQTLTCAITAISPEVDFLTRQVLLQGTLNNRKAKSEQLAPENEPAENEASEPGVLRPGMFVDVALQVSAPETLLTIPTTAVLYAPYGNSVFIIETGEDNILSLKQVFVQLGRKRGDFISVLSGLSVEDQIVSTGVFKLFNGMQVVVDNRLTPEFEQQPAPDDA